MQKRILGQIGILFFLGIPLLFNFKYYNFENIKKLITEEFNPFNISKLFFGDFFDSDFSLEVVDVPLPVYDYYAKDNILYVKYLSEEITMPISGVIYEINSEKISIYDADGNSYTIGNLTPKYHLYEYFEAYSVIGTSDSYIVISGAKAMELMNSFTESYDEI